MLDPIKERNKFWVSSVHLYDLLGRERKKYFKWINRHILKNQTLEVQKDYFLHKEFIGGWKNAQRAEYYLSIPLAFAICIREGTIVSKQIRYQLESTLKERIAEERKKVARR